MLTSLRKCPRRSKDAIASSCNILSPKFDAMKIFHPPKVELSKNESTVYYSTRWARHWVTYPVSYSHLNWAFGVIGLGLGLGDHDLGAENKYFPASYWITNIYFMPLSMFIFDQVQNGQFGFDLQCLRLILWSSATFHWKMGKIIISIRSNTLGLDNPHRTWCSYYCQCSSMIIQSLIPCDSTNAQW